MELGWILGSRKALWRRTIMERDLISHCTTVYHTEKLWKSLQTSSSEATNRNNNLTHLQDVTITQVHGDGLTHPERIHILFRVPASQGQEVHNTLLSQNGFQSFLNYPPHSHHISTQLQKMVDCHFLGVACTQNITSICFFQIHPNTSPALKCKPLATNKNG